jgi:hypothetical protein
MQAYPKLLQPQRNKASSCPLLNSVDRKPLVEVSATLFAEHKHGKAVGALPLKWSGLAALAHCCSWDTLRLEEATQVRANSWNKFFHEAVLGLRARLSDIKEGYVDQRTLLCSGASCSSIQDVSSTSMNERLASSNSARWSSTSISLLSLAGAC